MTQAIVFSDWLWFRWFDMIYLRYKQDLERDIDPVFNIIMQHINHWVNMLYNLLSIGLTHTLPILGFLAV
jgi:hypothetical protein